jgi:glutathione peroxidase
MSNLYDYSAKSIDGDERKLSDFNGKVVLIVNVASECGLTPQYDGLQRLYSRYRDGGLEILGFPCNQFGGQEPGSEAEIQKFCRSNYGVEFPLFEKVEVNGDDRHPLYAWLTGQEVGPDGAGDIAWNFAKFLVARDGTLIARFEPTIEPCSTDITSRIDEELGKP